MLRGIFRTKNLDDILATAGGPQFARERAERWARGVYIHRQQRIRAARVLGVDERAVRLKERKGELVRSASRVDIRRQAEIEGQQTARRK